MPIVTFRKGGQVQPRRWRTTPTSSCAPGIRKFPWPHLRYGCGMGKCGKCTCQVLAGAEHLPAPNWKEKDVLGENGLAQGYRLACQLWLHHDITLTQDRRARCRWRRRRQA